MHFTFRFVNFNVFLSLFFLYLSCAKKKKKLNGNHHIRVLQRSHLKQTKYFKTFKLSSCQISHLCFLYHHRSLLHIFFFFNFVEMWENSISDWFWLRLTLAPFPTWFFEFFYGNSRMKNVFNSQHHLHTSCQYLFFLKILFFMLEIEQSLMLVRCSLKRWNDVYIYKERRGESKIISHEWKRNNIKIFPETPRKKNKT